MVELMCARVRMCVICPAGSTASTFCARGVLRALGEAANETAGGAQSALCRAGS